MRGMDCAPPTVANATAAAIPTQRRRRATHRDLTMLDRSLCTRFRAFYSVTLCSQRCLEDILHVRLAMHEEHFAKLRRRRLHTVDPRGQLRPVSVGAVSIDDLHVGP